MALIDALKNEGPPESPEDDGGPSVVDDAYEEIEEICGVSAERSEAFRAALATLIAEHK